MNCFVRQASKVNKNVVVSSLESSKVLDGKNLNEPNIPWELHYVEIKVFIISGSDYDPGKAFRFLQ